jgi:hypothetical protein
VIEVIFPVIFLINILRNTDGTVIQGANSQCGQDELDENKISLRYIILNSIRVQKLAQRFNNKKVNYEKFAR